MPKQIVIAEQHRIAAVFSEDRVQELIVATGSHQVSDIYLGVVENVLPGIDAAFVNIGDAERNGFIHVSDLGPLRLRRSAGSITELLAPQQKVLVQIMKEPTGNKGPRLTGKISLPGRYLVLMPHSAGVNLSRRIDKEAERHRLRALAILIKPAGMGLVVRTEAEGVPEEAIIEDLRGLQQQWEEIQQEATSTRAPALLSRDDDFIQRVLRDVYSSEVNRIVADSHTGTKRVKQHLTAWNHGKLPQGVLVDHHRDRAPILEYFRVNAAIREALKPRVDLPSGGYIIIEPTEALTVIDVNSGSFTRSATARETVLWTNCEAAAEIARQLRLRNIAGVIVVDFIDMEVNRDRLQVLEHFSKALRSDKARPQIAQLSELGLVELTRKRQGQNIYELFGRACPTCGGLGHLVHLPDDANSDSASSLLPGVSDGSERPNVPMLQRSRASGGRRGARAAVTANPVSLIPGAVAVESEPSEFQDLDLSNHPSYQEQGSGSRRRRRRANNGTEEAAPVRGRTEGAPPRRDVQGNLPRPTVNARALDSALDEDGPEPLEEFAPLPEPSDNGTGEAVAASNGTGPSRRGRGRGRSPEAPPPEPVRIAMTPAQQDVYAWMGLSPLLLVTESSSSAPEEDGAVAVVPTDRPDGLDLEAEELPRGARSRGVEQLPQGSEPGPEEPAETGRRGRSRKVIPSPAGRGRGASAATDETTATATALRTTPAPKVAPTPKVEKAEAKVEPKLALDPEPVEDEPDSPSDGAATGAGSSERTRRRRRRSAAKG
jgi:ribonuclease E